ncbi:hypothetical protein Tco_1107373 [Tanacetum coccineum]
MICRLEINRTYQSYSTEEWQIENKSTMKGFETNDQTDYYLRITSITVNGKNAYELKGKFLDDLHKNAFSGTNGEDAKLGSDEIEPTDLEETDHDDEQEIGEIFRIETNLFDYETPLCEKFKEFNYLVKIDPNVLTKDIEGFNTYDEYKDDWIYEWNKNVPWPFNYKSGYLEWPTCSWKEDGYCNGGNLPGAYIVGNTLYYQDLELYDALKDSELKEEALRNKAIMEGLINKDVESNKGWKSWDEFEITNGDRNKREYENDQEDEEICELFNDTTQELPVCTIRRFKMIKYSFGQDKEYVAVKEDEYEDLTSISEDACRAYQEIFRIMEEGWMDLAAKKSTKLVKYQSSGILCVIVVMLEYKRIYNTHPCSKTQLGESTK